MSQWLETDYTGWFPARAKPIRSGVYEVAWVSAVMPDTVAIDGYAYYDTESGLWGWTCKVLDSVSMRGSVDARQDKRWRGITKGAWIRITEGLAS